MNPFQAIIIETGEQITLYALNNGNYYDYDNMGVRFPATSKTGKKEFTQSEIKKC